MGSKPNNLYLCSPAAPGAPARSPTGRSMHLDNCGAKHDTVNDTKEIGAAGDFVVWQLLSRSPLATTPRKEARFSMSEYTQVGVCTQAQPSTLTSTNLGPLYGTKSPLLSQMRGMGGLYRPPKKITEFA